MKENIKIGIAATTVGQGKLTYFMYLFASGGGNTVNSYL
jgi:hypothetical protein